MSSHNDETAQTKNTSETARNAKLLVGAEFPATSVVCAYFGKSAQPAEVLAEVKSHINGVQAGDFSSVQGMLMAQAISLQSMFVDLANRAKQETSMAGVQTLTQLALRAQAGSRATLESLVELNNPRQVAFVRQTNVAQNQVVNNASAALAHEKPEQNAQSKLIALETSDGSKILDTRAAASPSRTNSNDPALAKLNRAHQRRR